MRFAFTSRARRRLVRRRYDSLNLSFNVGDDSSLSSATSDVLERLAVAARELAARAARSRWCRSSMAQPDGEHEADGPGDRRRQRPIRAWPRCRPTVRSWCLADPGRRGGRQLALRPTRAGLAGAVEPMVADDARQRRAGRFARPSARPCAAAVMRCPPRWRQPSLLSFRPPFRTRLAAAAPRSTCGLASSTSCARTVCAVVRLVGGCTREDPTTLLLSP